MNRTFSPQPPSNIQPTSVSTEETLGVEGYCVVAVMEQDRWVPGDTRWGVRHRGRLYLFHDAASQQRFLSDPDRYSPALAGYDPVVFSERGAYSPGVREHGVRYNDRMYLFESETNLLRFSQQPDRYAESVQRAMGLSAP
jgi:YHS domain-containing protein